MSWIKRNLFFVVFSVAGLVLMGLAGWFGYSKWSLNNQVVVNLNSLYEDLKGLKQKNPHPGDAKVDNIKIAKEQQLQLSNFIASTRVHFKPIVRIPAPEEAPKITDRDFTTALSRTIDQLQKQASGSSVNVASNYNFSFEAERQRVQFDSKGLLPLSIQLGEVRTICDTLFQAKINSLDNIRRERVAPEDSLGGLQTDYLTEKTTTNELAVLTPYEVVFKCFSAELASVLSGLAASPHGFIIKSINVEGSPIASPQEQFSPTATPVTPMYIQQATPTSVEPDNRSRSRYRGGGGGGAASLGGIEYRGIQPNQPTYVQPMMQAPAIGTAARSGGLPTVLDERQLKVTMNLVLVKLLPAK